MTFASCVTVDKEGNLHDIGLTGLYESLGWPEEALVMFYWQSLGPRVSQAGLSSPRLREDVAAVLWRVGLLFYRRLPEADRFNFLPPFQVALLMMNGRSDCLIRCKHPSFRCSDFRARMKMTGGRHPGTEATAMLRRHFGR